MKRVCLTLYRENSSIGSGASIPKELDYGETRADSSKSELWFLFCAFPFEIGVRQSLSRFEHPLKRDAGSNVFQCGSFQSRIRQILVLTLFHRKKFNLVIHRSINLVYLYIVPLMTKQKTQ